MAVDDVALGDEVGAPHAVEELLAGDDLARPAGEQVQEALLDAAQVDDRRPVRTSRCRMSISISPIVIVGTIGRRPRSPDGR